MLRRLALAVLACAFAIAPHVQGQSACAQLGVDCSHPTIQQRPSSSTSSSSSRDSKPGKDAEDYAWDYTHNGNLRLDRWKENKSYPDFEAAKIDFDNALANIARFGPAELGLCRLYESIEFDAEATAACEIAMNSRFLDRKTKKWMKENLLARMNLRSRTQQSDKGYAEWKRTCGWTTGASDERSTVDPSADITRFINDCNKTKRQLDANQTKLNQDITKFNEERKR